MKQKIIGVYPIGIIQVQLVLREGVGGEYYTFPETGSLSRIKVGADHKQWRDVVGVLLHEAMEFTAMHLALRYAPAPDLSMDNGNYLFVMTHTQFSDVCARAGEFVSCSLPDLGREWGKWKKQAKE